MKKSWLFLFFTLFAILSCGKEIPFPQPNGPATAITFHLTADYDTRAVKESWEEGDVIFVFFSEVAAPNYLKMCYDGSSWSYVPVGSLNLQDEHTGTMRAVYLPFGNKETVSASGADFVFGHAYMSYYLTASLDYTVVNHTVSGNFRMSVPEGFVQFFVEDTAAVDRGYKLSTYAVTPVEITGVASDGSVMLNTAFGPGGYMYGYAYKGGYLFSGLLSNSYPYGNNFYFAKANATSGARADYVVVGQTLESHTSVKLPAASSTKWQSVGSDVTVSMKTTVASTTYDFGIWYTCNEGEALPEKLTQSAVPFSTAAAGVTTNKVLPTPALLNGMASHLTWFPMRVLPIQEGMVAYASTGRFLFFPFKTDMQDPYLEPPFSAGYWSTAADDTHANYFWVRAAAQTVGPTLKSYQYYVRYLSSLTNPKNGE